MGKGGKQGKEKQASEKETEVPESSPVGKKRGREEDSSELPPVARAGSGILTEVTFQSLELEAATQQGLEELGYTHMTRVQRATLPHLLSGADLAVAARTGSGKTVAFLLPVIEMLSKARFTARNGVGALILAPTRELCIQIYGVAKALMAHHSQTHGLVMGGSNRKEEARRLQRGVNLLVATPGRLLDHMQSTSGFVFHNLQALVMDEADRILEVGFEEELHQIVSQLPKERQTMLFSATQTQNIKDLIRLSMKPSTKFLSVDEARPQATVEGLTQGYVVVPSDQRFLLLYSFLQRNQSKKIIVFFSSCNSVKFHGELLNFVDVPVLDLHGKQKQKKRTNTFFEFINAKSGILLSTDVAARGLDIPAVDWIVQYDPPDDPREYIHRVGRTARGTDGRGRALMFLLPSELGFLQYLQEFKVSLEEYDFPASKVSNVQSELERLIEKNYYLHKSAREAYRSYLLAYASHQKSALFNVHQLDLLKVAKSFGFTIPPKVNLALAGSARDPTKHARKQRRVEDSPRAASHQPFSAANPRGVRDKADSRQFSR